MSKILALMLSGLGTSCLLADDSVWRLDTIGNKIAPEFCSDPATKSGSIVAALIPFGDIIYGMNESVSNQDSWFIGELASMNNNIHLSAFVPEYEENVYIPIDYAPVQISRGAETYYPEPLEYEPLGRNIGQNEMLPYLEETEPYLKIARKNEATPSYKPIMQEVTVPDHSVYGNGPQFKNKTIRFYPFR